MKKGIYPRLALDSIRKNKRLYLPYILTCIGMVMMQYIVEYLKTSSAVKAIRGQSVLIPILNMGSFVLGAFALVFLFYTNSFLIRRRNKEFGLYNILGMGKKNIAKVLFWETAIIGSVSITGGVIFGILFSKLAELLLIKIMNVEADFSFSLSLPGIGLTVIIFTGIFVLLFINSVRKVSKGSAINLVKSESIGEKAPKANWLLGIPGFVILGAAYYLAVTVSDAVDALLVFFIAVIMVIIATYMIMISGSVMLCKLLQKNKKYYYNKKHFVSVSSMSYRMKRNGAGLASICIIATMVLVTVSSTSCLYFGEEDALTGRYPYEYNLEVDFAGYSQLGDENIQKFRDSIDNIAEKNGVKLKKVFDIRYANFVGGLFDNNLYTENFKASTYSTIRDVYVFSVDDFNAANGTSFVLADDECVVYCEKAYDETTLKIDDSLEYVVAVSSTDKVGVLGYVTDSVVEMVVVVNDLEKVAEFFDGKMGEYGSICNLKWHCGVDTGLDNDSQIRICMALDEGISQLGDDAKPQYSWFMSSHRANAEDDFYTTYGGLFFIGLMLSGVFICAAVLIIYYKQISEGYEDQSRFEIMQKVGMTKKEIRKSINSQLLTVFYLPLIFAGMHLAFAFPLVRMLLMLFNLDNIKLFMLTNSISFAVFALLYALVYKITSNAYYNIVSGAKAE